MNLKNLFKVKFFSNSIIILAFQIIPIITALISLPLNIKHLGIELWGAYSLSISIFFLVMYFNLGIGPAVNRKISSSISLGKKIHEKIFAQTGFYLNLFIVFVLSVILLIFSSYIQKKLLADTFSLELKNSVYNLFFYISIASGFYLIISYIRNTIEARQSFIFVSLARAIFSSFILIAPLLTNPNNIELAGLYIIVLVLVLLTAYMIIFTRIYGFPSLNFYSKPFQKEIIIEGAFMSAYSAVNPIFIYLDRYLIGIVLSLYLAGVYTSFYDLISRITIIASSISIALFPSAAYFSMNKKELKKIFVLALKYTAILSFFPVLIMVLFGSQFLSWWLNDSFPLDYSNTIIIISAAYFVHGINSIYLKTFHGIKLLKFPLFLSLSLAIFYVPALYYSLFYFGLIGAALIFLIKNLIELFFNYIYMNLFFK